jgi:phage-related protein
MNKKKGLEEGYFREVVYYERYYLDFFNELHPSLQKKFNWTLMLISKIERVPEKYLKHISGTAGLYEVRIEHESNTYRVFGFFDEGNLLVLMNAFQKKTQKTPRREIKKAEQLKKQYYNEKEST